MKIPNICSKLVLFTVLTSAVGAFNLTRWKEKNSIDAENCRFALRTHQNYEPGSFCPDILTEQSGAHVSSFSQCKPLPHRRCIHPIPDQFSPPVDSRSYLHNPPSGNVRFAPGSRFSDFSQLSRRKNEDCDTCWRFNEERTRWNSFLNFIERVGAFNFRNGPVRTALDFGSGSGGFLAALAERRVNGLGFARNWQQVPYLETAAARGVLAMHMDFRNHVPMVSGAVDLVHCSWLMNILDTKEDIEAILMEWDRLVRPGGYVVQYGFRSKTPEKYEEQLEGMRSVAKRLRWQRLFWSSSKADSNIVLLFVFRKPVQRTRLGD